MARDLPQSRAASTARVLRVPRLAGPGRHDRLQQCQPHGAI